MLTFREFYGICEGKKPNAHPYAVPGTYQEKDGVKTYTLKRDDAPKREPIKSAKKITKMLDKQGGIGGKAIKKAEKKVKSVSEDLEARRQQLAQRQRDNVAAFKERSTASANAQKERVAKQRDREQLKSEIKRELQTEQHPTMEPNLYSQLVARRQASQKSSIIKQVHSDLSAEKKSQERQKEQK